MRARMAHAKQALCMPSRCFGLSDEMVGFMAAWMDGKVG